MTPILNFTTEEVSALFDGTNFGPRGETDAGRRMLMAGCLLKAACGYASGNVITRVCRTAGLITGGIPTREGLRWMYHGLTGERDGLLRRVADLEGSLAEMVDVNEVTGDPDPEVTARARSLTSKVVSDGPVQKGSVNLRPTCPPPPPPKPQRRA